MKIYTIIGGVNGAGKSSFTGSLKAQTADLGVIIDVDKITACTGSASIEGGKIAITRIQECLDRNVCFTQETTLSGHRTEITASEALARGYYIRLYYIGLNTVDEHLKRVANRVARGGHGIGDDDVARRFGGRWESLEKVLPYCNEARFFDNDNGFMEVAEYRNGELVLKGEARPEWIVDFQRYLIP